MTVDGQEDPVRLTYAMVVPGFFETMGMDLAAGRPFEVGDTTGSSEVAVVNQSLASRYFPGSSPVGRTLWRPGQRGEAELRYEIVGVVSDAKVQDFFAGSEPAVYFSYPQHYYTPGNAVLLSTTIGPSEAVPLFEEELRAIDPTLALVNALPYSEVISGFQFIQRRNAEVFSLAAVLGMVLAAAGLYGALLLSVGERKREIGVRMALGAGTGKIVGAIMPRALSAVVVGAALGILACLAAAPVVRGLLVDVRPREPTVVLAGVGVLLLVSAAAALVPLWRALRVDPSVPLREG
jgi:hypothetical protein